MEPSKKIKLLLVDDHQLIRDGVKSMLDNTMDMQVIGSVQSGEDAINFARENPPDVILMDIMMGGMTGIEATRWIKDTDPAIKIILLTMENDKDHIATGIKAGANGYLLKNVDKETLLKAVRTVHEGGRFFNEEVMKIVFEDLYVKEKEKKTERKS
jgi:two-component system response regulator NreC